MVKYQRTPINSCSQKFTTGRHHSGAGPNMFEICYIRCRLSKTFMPMSAKLSVAKSFRTAFERCLTTQYTYKSRKSTQFSVSQELLAKMGIEEGRRIIKPLYYLHQCISKQASQFTTRPLGYSRPTADRCRACRDLNQCGDGDY